MVPMIWFRDSASVTADIASRAVIALSLKRYGYYTSSGVGVFGVLLLFIGVSCLILGLWKEPNQDDEEDELIHNESEIATT